jgi:hypothetical protein
MARIQTTFPKRFSFPDMTPAQREKGLRTASTESLREAYTDNIRDFPLWLQSPQLREAQAVMHDELIQRDSIKQNHSIDLSYTPKHQTSLDLSPLSPTGNVTNITVVTTEKTVKRSQNVRFTS